MKRIEIKLLDHSSIAEVARAFNAAFVDYKVKMELSEEAMAAKMKAENIVLHYSAGAYDEGELVGFILNASDNRNNEKVIYNAGTGVLPSYRGKKLTHKLYKFIIPQLKQQGFKKHQLEVFEDNEKAIKVYAGNGFEVNRKMLCYKGTIANDTLQPGSVKEINLEPSRFTSFWDIQPSWQNDLPSIQRNPGEHTVIGIEENGALVAYAIYIKNTGRVKQFAVKHTHRRNGLAGQLFAYINSTVESPDLLLTCVEETVAVDNFLKSLGLLPIIDMYEMKLDVCI